MMYPIADFSRLEIPQLLMMVNRLDGIRIDNIDSLGLSDPKAYLIDLLDNAYNKPSKKNWTKTKFLAIGG